MSIPVITSISTGWNTQITCYYLQDIKTNHQEIICLKYLERNFKNSFGDAEIYTKTAQERPKKYIKCLLQYKYDIYMC